MAKQKAQKKKKQKKVSYYRQPEELSLRDWQISLRKQFGPEQTFELVNEGEHPVWSDFTVINPERNSRYRVALRGQEPGVNFCECMDFKTNGLGTCKHIEWALHKLYHTYGNKQHFRKPPPERQYSSVYLEYGEERRLRLRLGGEEAEALEILSRGYFDGDGVLYEHAYLEFDQFLEKAKAISSTFRCYADALDFVIQKRADEQRGRRAAAIAKAPGSLEGLVKAKLYPYQMEGVLFALKAGRCLIADEMGLGKTIQAIAAAELYRRELGIGNVYIICPTSLKYQWRSEIERFTGQKAHVVEGPAHKRREQYEDFGHTYKILTYNVVARDYPYLNAANPDLVIIDEAQRIKNWDTKISRAVKRLEAPYRIALTGTPLENKLEDLYSIVQFLDQYLLGPLYLLLYRHQVKDESGVVRGYKNLDAIYKKLNHVMIRRRKRQVLKQLPARQDQQLLVPMTPRQLELHNSYDADVAQLVAKWRRMGFLNEKDRRRLLSCLNLMRMSCNSTYLVDQQTRHDTKIEELFYILEERLAEEGESAVIFSQWERMTRIVAQELEAREIPFAYLHGGIPGSKRGELLDRFRDDPACRVFLSTDAGGVGLNLQKASLVVNLDLPWNPAVLEQRIGRVFRIGQERQVQVINLIAEGTIEHRLVQTLQFKSSLAEAVLDTAQDSVFMNDRKFKDFMEELERVKNAEVPDYGAAEASSDEDLEKASVSGPSEKMEPAEAALDAWWEDEAVEPEAAPQPRQGRSTGTGQSSPSSGAGLLSEGLSFLGRLSQTLSDEKATQRLVNEIVEKDEQTGQSYLKIPVEDSEVVKHAAKLLGGLLSKLG
ncbi:DEAD/DEAH box helicase [Phaeodactylibacter luteus]|uniref:DEAD/DEAH box helicase n=1 Tax=Phaeodactylibacter luteus TaxID=1564516 RepID=A0A5C6RZD0_9BACT|nr:DEAD/DEAH box helicase [Phaeodactylibacter luteus]TXB67956.1 DEAD/DEAH box helicase [Phaeodactylibacter luteus]